MASKQQVAISAVLASILGALEVSFGWVTETVDFVHQNFMSTSDRSRARDATALAFAGTGLLVSGYLYVIAGDELGANIRHYGTAIGVSMIVVGVALFARGTNA